MNLLNLLNTVLKEVHKFNYLMSLNFLNDLLDTTIMKA